MWLVLLIVVFLFAWIFLGIWGRELLIDNLDKLEYIFGEWETPKDDIISWILAIVLGPIFLFQVWLNLKDS